MVPSSVGLLRTDDVLSRGGLDPTGLAGAGPLSAGELAGTWKWDLLGTWDWELVGTWEGELWQWELVANWDCEVNGTSELKPP